MLKHWILFIFVIVLSASAWAGEDEGTEAGAADSVPVLSEVQPLAEQGDAAAQFELGTMYENGEGIAQNDAVAADWFRKSALQGNADAQNELGRMYAAGQGVPKDYKTATGWYRKAADQGNEVATGQLGWFYAKGHGVKRDLVEAERLYMLAASLGDDWSQGKLDELRAAKPCLKKASSELFGEMLLCTNRNALREAVQAEGANATNEDDAAPYDEYDSTQVLDGSTALRIGYYNGKFAHADYTFDPAQDAGAVQGVRSMVAGKYGKPAKVSGKRSGPVNYLWKLKDGILISVSQAKPDASVHMEFIQPANFALLIRSLKVKGKPAKTVKQSQAF